MAKKKQKPFAKPGDKGFVRRGDGKAKLSRPVIQSKDTGIYLEKSVVGWDDGDISHDEQAAILQDAGDHATQLTEILDAVAKDAAHVLRPHAHNHDPADRAIPKGRRIVGGIDLGDGPACYTFPTDLPDAADEALEVFRFIHEVRARGESKSYGLSNAIELGRLLERMYVRPHEPNALRGKKVLRGAQSGHAVVHGSDNEKSTRRAQYRKAFNAEYPSRCRRKGAAYQLVAARFGVSHRTIQRAISHPGK